MNRVTIDDGQTDDEKVVDLQCYARNTCLLQRPNGSFEPIADDDPRAKDCYARLTYDYVFVTYASGRQEQWVRD